MTPLPRCTVRGCGRVLSREGGRLACDAGHSFDVARSGHVTLLQPQDRRSATPGDSAEAVSARARALSRGAGDALAESVNDLARRHVAAARPAVLDIGCGEGFFLRSLARVLDIDACGIEISSRAAAAAAKAMPEALIVVANADRSLPWPDASFDVVLSITARRPIAEMRRVLKPEGIAVVAVPAEDDLVELREAAQGRGERRDRLEKLRAEMGAAFREIAHRTARVRIPLEPEEQRDLLASTYRGARRSEQERLAGLGAQVVTLAHEVLAWSPA